MDLKSQDQWAEAAASNPNAIRRTAVHCRSGARHALTIGLMLSPSFRCLQAPHYGKALRPPRALPPVGVLGDARGARSTWGARGTWIMQNCFKRSELELRGSKDSLESGPRTPKGCILRSFRADSGPADARGDGGGSEVATLRRPGVLACESPLGGDRGTCAGRSGRSVHPGCSGHFRQALGHRPRLPEARHPSDRCPSARSEC
eukprot:9670170-Alexandrium_andersonii.AAC.2